MPLWHASRTESGPNALCLTAAMPPHVVFRVMLMSSFRFGVDAVQRSYARARRTGIRPGKLLSDNELSDPALRAGHKSRQFYRGSGTALAESWVDE